MRRDKKLKVKWIRREIKKMIKKKKKNWIAHGICEPNFECNSDKRQNKIK
jgi:ribosome recycling factor